MIDQAKIYVYLSLKSMCYTYIIRYLESLHDLKPENYCLRTGHGRSERQRSASRAALNEFLSENKKGKFLTPL